MSKKANPTAIGLFIVVGVALGAIGLLLFSSSKMFSRTYDGIVYFNESLNGLNEGAPVKYRGVTIGSVKRVMVSYSQDTNDYAMPVIIEVEQKLIQERLHEQIGAFTQASIAERVKRGLRASLQTESLVTGVLYIDMRYSPDAPPPVYHELEKRYPEIPSEPTQIQQLFNSLASLDIGGIGTNVNALLLRIESKVDSLQVGELQKGITNLLGALDRLVSNAEITNDLIAVRTTLNEYRLLAEKLNGRVDPLADSLTNSLAEAKDALRQMRGAVENVRTMLAPDSPVRNGLELALQQLGDAAQSISTLAEFLNRHPNALIAGRDIPKKKP